MDKMIIGYHGAEQAVLAASLAAAVGLEWLNWQFTLFGVLFVLMAAAMFGDLLTRVYAAWISDTERVESRKVRRGLKKKLGYCLLVLVGLLMDAGLRTVTAALGVALETDLLFSILIMSFLLVQELISMLENLADAGMAMPGTLLRALQKASDAISRRGDELTGAINDEPVSGAPRINCAPKTDTLINNKTERNDKQ